MSIRFQNLSDAFCKSIKAQLAPRVERYLAIESQMEVLGSHQAKEAERLVDLIADHVFAALDPYVTGIDSAAFESDDAD